MRDFSAPASSARNRTRRFSGRRYCSTLASNWALRSASVGCTPARNCVDVKTARSSFTFSLRRRYSCSTSASVTPTHPVTSACSFSPVIWRADLLLEVGRLHRRALHRQELLVLRLADELAVLLEGRDRDDALPQFLVGDPDAEALGFDQHGFLVDQLLEDALADAELLQHLLVELVAVRGPQRRGLLLVRALVGGDQNLPAVNRGDRVGGRGAAARWSQEAGDVEDDERHHYDAKAPLEPVPVSPHPIEHRHERRPPARFRPAQRLVRDRTRRRRAPKPAQQRHNYAMSGERAVTKCLRGGRLTTSKISDP